MKKTRKVFILAILLSAFALTGCFRSGNGKSSNSTMHRNQVQQVSNN